jgi:hypothetical protein
MFISRIRLCSFLDQLENWYKRQNSPFLAGRA